MQRTTDLTRRRAEFDKSPDIDLQKLWDKAKEDFERETRMTLDDAFSVSDIPDKIKAVNAMPEPEDDETGTEKSSGISKKAIAKDVFQRAKTIFAKVFKVIWNFSEFFLPAAEQIPIVGAGVSFLAKAIDLLIQTTRNYRDIFLKAAQLFEQVGFFSIRFEMLMEAESAGAELHPKYRQFLHRIMTQAVSCIALYIRLTNEAKGSVDNGSTREMIKRKFKSGTHVTMRFFHIMATGYDEDVGARTAELQKLIEEEGRLSSALILASVLKIHKDVGTINTSVNTMSGKLSHVHEMIMEYSTSLGPSRVDQLKTLFCIANEPWNDAFRAIAERRIPGTGVWLLEHDGFNAWVAAQDDSPHIFAVEAGSNFGKTYLATIGIAHLHERTLRTNAKSSIAFYYFDKASKDLTAAAIIRAIAYQICTHNSQFSDLALPIMKEFDGRKSNAVSGLAINLWTSLIINVSAELAGSTFFVVLDGLELLSTEQLHVISRAVTSLEMANRNLRILLTGNASSLEFVARYAGTSFSKVVLDTAYPNRSDITLVTEAGLARCDFFSDGLDSPELLECMASIRNRLVQAVAGDYYLLLSQIREIRHLASIGEINRVLSRTSYDREAIIKRNLSNLAVTVSKTELMNLRDALHLLAVLDILGAPMPHITVISQYLASGKASASTRTSIQSAYSGLVATDAQGCLSLATDEMTSLLLPESTKSQATISSAHGLKDQQVNAIRQFLSATFNQNTLDELGIDDGFFESRSRLSSLSSFTVERNYAMSNIAFRFMDCLSELSTTQRNSNSHPLYSISAFARQILPRLIHHIDASRLEDGIEVDLGTEIARLFFDDGIFELFWPVEALSQTQTIWGENGQYFDAVYDLIKHPDVIQRLKGQQWSVTLASELQNMSKASDLKVAASKMIAQRWLLSKLFWTSDEIRLFILWFSTIPELDLEEKNVVEESYYESRTTGWFTPPNWRKIEAWVTKNIPINDPVTFDIQKAAVLLTLGATNSTPSELLDPHCKTDWRANVWLAEATSRTSCSAAFDEVDRCLDALLGFDIDQATTTRVYDCFLDWIAHWGDDSRKLQIRVKMIELNKQRPDSLSTSMWANTMVAAFHAQKFDGGFDFFQAQYQARKNKILETFVRQASYNYLHLALSRTLGGDSESRRLQFLRGVYQEAIALCDSIEMMPPQEIHIARVRLTFWLGRLFFFSKDVNRLREAIALWESLLKDFLHKPSTRDLDVLLPITVHLCSAYLQVVLQGNTGLEADQIMSQLTKLHDVARFSQKPIALKLHFRVSLCLARIYVVRNERAKAREILQEHADSAFAMLTQQNNRPLFSIGWLYLASILTTLDEDEEREKWAWSKVKPYQPMRWLDKDYYKWSSNRGENPPLEAAVKQKIEAIKIGEEYAVYDGILENHVSTKHPDDFYLPSYATMFCDARGCRAETTDAPDESTNLGTEPLQIPAGILFDGDFPPAQYGNPQGRTAFRVCRDCMLSKTCVTCYSRLEAGFLPPTGCDQSHSALIVPESYSWDDDAYEFLYSYDFDEADGIDESDQINESDGGNEDGGIDGKSETDEANDSDEANEIDGVNESDRAGEPGEADEDDGVDESGEADELDAVNADNEPDEIYDNFELDEIDEYDGLDDSIPYEVSDADMEIIAEESKKWGIKITDGSQFQESKEISAVGAQSLRVDQK